LRDAAAWLIDTGPFGLVILFAAIVVWVDNQPLKRQVTIFLAGVGAVSAVLGTALWLGVLPL
jgi:hypothetical protein